MGFACSSIDRGHDCWSDKKKNLHGPGKAACGACGLRSLHRPQLHAGGSCQPPSPLQTCRPPQPCMPEARRDTLRQSATAQTLGNVLETHGAGLTACLQSSRMIGEGAVSSSAQHGATEHSSVAALPCTTVGCKDCHGIPCWSAWLWCTMAELEQSCSEPQHAAALPDKISISHSAPAQHASGTFRACMLIILEALCHEER